MTEEDSMEAKLGSISVFFPNDFISCIKFHGKPILPPFLNDEKRAEMVKYRQLAVEREKKRNSKVAVTHDQASLDTNVGHSIINSQSSPRPISEEIPSESTDLGRYMAVSAEKPLTARSDGSATSTTITESLRTAISEDNLNVNIPRSTLVRSESFTVETPSRALLESVQSYPTQELRSPFEQHKTPEKSNMLTVKLSSLSASPVISEKFSQIVTGVDTVSDVTINSAREQLEQFEEMEQMLEQYHQLQLEELKMRHLEDVDRLIKQKQHLEAIVESVAESSSADITSNAAETSCNNSTTPTLVRSSSSPGQSDISRRYSRNSMPLVLRKNLAAMVKGYLTRRLMKTDRMLELIETVKEIRSQLQQIDAESNGIDNNEDCFREMIINQLESAHNEIFLVLFVKPIAGRMSLIERQRIVDQATKHRKVDLKNRRKGKRLSLATRKSMARKGLTMPPGASPLPSPRPTRQQRRRTEQIMVGRTRSPINKSTFLQPTVGSAKSRRPRVLTKKSPRPKQFMQKSSRRSTLLTSSVNNATGDNQELSKKPWR